MLVAEWCAVAVENAHSVLRSGVSRADCVKMGESCRALLGHDPVPESLELPVPGQADSGDVTLGQAHQPFGELRAQSGSRLTRFSRVGCGAAHDLLPSVDRGGVPA